MMLCAESAEKLRLPKFVHMLLSVFNESISSLFGYDMSLLTSWIVL